MPFGKHKGKLLTDIAEEFPAYIRWLVTIELKDPLKSKIEDIFNSKQFQTILAEYEENERQYYDAVRDCWEEW